MFTGWWPSLKFSLNRPLSDEERAAALPHQGPVSEPYDDRNSLVAFNSTYIEWIDRRFFVRGSINTALTFLGSFGIFFGALWALKLCFSVTDKDTRLVGIVGFILISMMSAALYYAQPRLDFFKKIYYPIRFNRKNGMIYVYRDKKDGGILSAPWDNVFFHIGHGLKNTNLCDIRGEILEGKQVKDTFALGHFFERPQPVQQMWAFIRRYMEGGPEAVGENPLDRYVELSVKPSLKNCFLMVYTYYGAPTAALRILSLPFITLSTVTRWLVFKTCTMPVWPTDIEEACRVEPNDSHIWPVAETIGEFAANNPAIMARAAERARGASSATGSSSLADQIGDWQEDIQRKK